MNGNDIVDKADKRVFLGWIGGLVWLLTAFTVIVVGVCVPDDANASDEFNTYVPPPVIVTRDRDVDDDSSTLTSAIATTANVYVENDYSNLVCSYNFAEKIVEQATHYAALMTEPASENEEKLVIAQIGSCPRSGVALVADPFYVLALLRLENDLGVPDEARGILGAVWCIEAAMRLKSRHGTEIRGDLRNGKKMAHGPFQLWPTMRSLCHLTDDGADDLFVAATCYWQRVQYRHDVQTSKECKKNSWRTAEALVANTPRYAHYGCAAESKHWHFLKAVKQKNKNELR